MRKHTGMLAAFVVLGAMLFASPASAHVPPALRFVPTVDTRPEILSAQLMAPQPHNSLLEADLIIDATDDEGVVGFEYRWNSATFGRPSVVAFERPTVDYSKTRPDTPYALQVRAIDADKNASEWFSVWSGMTPGRPHVIIAGDSVASGYVKQWFTGDATCNNAALSYGRTVVAEIARGLPNVWEPTYDNIAWPGAGVEEMIAGGTDSCGVSHASQLDEIQELTDGSTWNIVVITAGINSTNWADVVIDLTRSIAISITESGDRAACSVALRDTWNLSQRGSAIASSTAAVVEILDADVNASVYWTSYYDITGTKMAFFWTPIGQECSDDMASALDELHGILRSGLTDAVTWVDIDLGIETQSWAGWPHPSANGHETIGRTIARSILES